MTITEVKHHLDGRQERYDCELLDRSGTHALVRFVFDQPEPYANGPFRLPAGRITTLAAFWEDRPYLVYRLLAGTRRLIGHRFDVCDSVRITDREIHWTDLLLDAWLPAGGRVHILDRDEMTQAVQTGLLSGHQQAVIARAETELRHHATAIAHEVASLAMEADVAEGSDDAEHEPSD